MARSDATSERKTNVDLTMQLEQLAFQVQAGRE